MFDRSPRLPYWPKQRQISQTSAFNPTRSHSPNPLKKSLPRVSIKFEKFRLSMHGAVVWRRCNYIPKKLYGLDTSSLMMHWTIFFRPLVFIANLCFKKWWFRFIFSFLFPKIVLISRHKKCTPQSIIQKKNVNVNQHFFSNSLSL